jgi:hypothetical protein
VEQKTTRRSSTDASLKKHIYIIACFALGVPWEASQAVAKLQEALPELDTSGLKTIHSFRNQAEPPVNNLRDILRRTLMFVENLHDEIIELRSSPKLG